ncbi:hypothetical protein L4D00_23445 [Photobacterium swingsii]|uniref:Uncharacterized protein n=1 Tax=Photobacterium swingsii TaxID=680026 RepID=A0A0J8VHE2_9GAMM|nr:hypothetical protein [Photobacterium swingsii]KMV31900.1 hypothetical protein AB733_03940 [Photobacterium swingsii]PSW25548.1 hypothetical protein C9I94_07855 [Photobacterium swingsii]
MNYIEFNDDTYAYNPIRYLPMNEVEFKHSFRVAIENKGISKIITIGQLVYGFILGGVLYMSPDESDEIKVNIITLSKK